MEEIDAPQVPVEPDAYFPWLKGKSEALWSGIEIKRGVFGFQTQPNTKWLPGLSEREIREYEAAIGFPFPEIYRTYLRNMNGTDRPAVNVYGYSDNVAERPMYYSYPRDLDVVRNTIQWIYDSFSVDEEFVRREKIPHLIPIVGHRFLLMDNCARHPVLSIYGNDSILYAPDLESFLIADIFNNSTDVFFEPDFAIKFWLDSDYCL